MTESERDLLMPFLRKLVQTRTTPGDDAANTLIRSALERQPNASYLLVQRALTLECELAHAQSRISVLEGTAPAAAMTKPATDFLNLSTSGWGEMQNRNTSVTTSKKLYDFLKDAHSGKEMDLESRAISFLDRNSRKVWLFILVLSVAVVFLR
jgi:hypothetical protein